MVEAGEHDQLDQLLIGPERAQRAPQLVGERGRRAARRPGGSACARPPTTARSRRRHAACDLGVGEAEARGEERHVHAPLVLAAAAAQVRRITSSRSRRSSGPRSSRFEARIFRGRAGCARGCGRAQRGDARRHHAGERRRRRRGRGRRERCEAVVHRLLSATVFVANYRYFFRSARGRRRRGDSATRRARARLAHRPPDHGRARSARTALGAAGPLGAARGALPFRALRAACGGVSPTVLNTRLAELREAGILEPTPEGYAVTELGRELCRALAPLEQWTQRWAKHAP